MAVLAPRPMIPAYSLSKIAAFKRDRMYAGALALEQGSRRLRQIGPIETDMSRGFEIPRVSPEMAARDLRRALLPARRYLAR